MIRSLPLLLAAALLLPVVSSAQSTVPAGGAAASAPSARLQPGDAAPDFTVTGPKGETLHLSDYRGKVVIVDVSATWCGPCQAAMPNNDRVYRKYAAQGVVLLGVTADDSREAYDGWIKRNASRYSFTMAFDPAGRAGWDDSVFNKQYHISGFPTMFVIGRDGRIVETVSGGGPGEDYRLEYALARAGVPVDLASIPLEPKKDANAPKAIPMMAKTAAMPAGMAGGGQASGLVPAAFGSIKAGETVPEFSLVGPAGQTVRLADFKGKPLLLHFTTGRGPQPWFLDIVNTYREQGLVTLVVFAATERAEFDAWRAKNPSPSFAVAWDPAGKAWAEGVPNTSFGVGMFPATVVVGADGKLVSGIIGMSNRVAVSIKMMLVAARAVKPTEADLAAIRAAVQAARPAGGMTAAPARPKPATLQAGAAAPDFLSLTLDGREVRLAGFKDKIVILDFWATWCGPCMASMPHTQELAARYKDQDVVVVASCTSDTRAKFEEWVRKNQGKYPDLLFTCDPHERGSAQFEERASGRLYHVAGIPTQFIIGRDGRIAATLVGYEKGDARAEATLAKLGVKVDEALVTQGRAQLAKDEEEAKARAAAAAENAKNPPPPFFEDFGRLKAGQVAPDVDVVTAAGATVKLSSVAPGHIKVVGVWSARGSLPPALPALWSEWQGAYADQQVTFIGLGAFGPRPAFEAWGRENADKINFTLLYDAAGAPPEPPKPMDEMSDDEKKAFGKLQSEHYGKVAPMRWGGIITPIPAFLVFDAAGKLVGWSAGFGDSTAAALGNLLLRAGVKLQPAHQPARVYTAAETKPPPAEAKVAMLKPGAAAPDFITADAAGHPVKLSDFKGKVVILDFWATWCGPCMASMPHTQEVAARYRDQGVVVLGSCTSDTRAKFEDWVKRNQEKYPDILFAHDAAERSPERASHRLYGVEGIPTQFVIDREGRIAGIVIGYLKGEAILDATLSKAGVKVDPALVTKGEADLKKRGS